MFTGQVQSRTQMTELLDYAHLFALPSRTEGLPRAMIDAIARGLPCIGTAVGGIPEPLSEENLVPSGDSVALAHKMVQIVSQPGRMAQMSATNLKVARNYCDSVLGRRRREFLEHVRLATERWALLCRFIFP